MTELNGTNAISRLWTNPFEDSQNVFAAGRVVEAWPRAPLDDSRPGRLARRPAANVIGDTRHLLDQLSPLAPKAEITFAAPVSRSNDATGGTDGSGVGMLAAGHVVERLTHDSMISR